jgi:hypothetical protein
MKELTAEQFYDFTCKEIEYDLIKNKLKDTDNYAFDFYFLKDEIPSDFQKDLFLEIIKDYFLLGEIEIEEVMGYKYRLIGRKIKKASIQESF